MINCFDEEYAFLSNFFDSPITDGELWYPTVEHYFQAMKTLDPEKRQIIAEAPTPGKAKRLGRRVELRADWEQVKDQIMYEALQKKFFNPLLKKMLLATGDERLEEGNHWHDNYWGVCYCYQCQDILAKNNLGKALMRLRAELRKDKAL